MLDARAVIGQPERRAAAAPFLDEQPFDAQILEHGAQQIRVERAAARDLLERLAREQIVEHAELEHLEDHLRADEAFHVVERLEHLGLKPARIQDFFDRQVFFARLRTHGRCSGHGVTL